MTGDDQPGYAHGGSAGGYGAVSGATRRPSSGAASSALEQEQRRLAQVIHDGPAQVFANLALHSEIIERLIGVDNARAVQEVRELRDEALRAATELRQMIDQVAPPGLLRRGLAELLREHAERLERRYGLSVAIDTGDDLVMSDADRITIFRVIQEALQNVLRHSASRRAWVRVYRVARDLVAEVRDQGTGFQATEGTGQEGGHLGVAGMRERAQMAGGTLLIESSPGAGTRVVLRLPR
ncbi:MAG TPA: sensor histidine kinase [Chloroflexota bacterium]|jgi:two-component system sensor histidine kinase DegS|nr:sensor histidine kinase [Chloroflexota bacterium]